jgi:hypothetical protein
MLMELRKQNYLTAIIYWRYVGCGMWYSWVAKEWALQFYIPHFVGYRLRSCRSSKLVYYVEYMVHTPVI